ncbi:MAG: MBL fold metallo-hydrolase [Candidatus Bathyarchaeia archaeon]
MRLDRVSDRVYANTEGKTGGNVGVILLKHGAVAVDSQYPGSAKLFREAIGRLTEGKVTHLLLTHYHGDHVFGGMVFEDCEIVAHRLLKEKMEFLLKTDWAPGNLERMLQNIRQGSPERAWLYEDLRIILPTKTFEDRFILGDGEITVEMIHTGGHSAGSSIVYIPEEEALFAGDLLFAKTFPWAGDESADPDMWIEAFEMILKMDVETIIPGHGPLSDEAEVEEQLSFFKAVREEMRRLIGEGASMEEAVKYDGYPPFYESGTLARRENSLRQWYRVWSTRR